jgi:hypothetical protein
MIEESESAISKIGLFCLSLNSFVNIILNNFESYRF